MRRRPSSIHGRLFLLSAVLLPPSVPACKQNEVPQARIEPGPPPLPLVVLTPHNEIIREAFERGFGEWHLREHGRPVVIRWVSMGTPQCLRYVEEAASNNELAVRGKVPDLMFGGGVTEHRELAERGFARKLTAAVPEETAIPKSLRGAPLVDDAGRWHATALSDFGIFFNRKACHERGLPEPAAWEDLASPAYYGWVAVADPTRSGSNRFCLDLILQRYGWEQGWGLILRLAANARTLLPGSTAVLENVSSGMCLAGLSVNFAALQEVAADEGWHLAYVTPVGASAITPDVITILSYASSPELAERFVRFCLSDAGQAFWGVQAGSGAPDGTSGEAPPATTVYETLYRYPVVPAAYQKFAGRLSVPDNPFERTTDLVIDMDLEQKQARIVGPLLLAACGENHILLQKAWKAVIDAGLPLTPGVKGLPAEALAELTRPPFDEKTAYELGLRFEKGDDASGLAADWSAAFRAKYEKVISLAGGTP